MLCDVIYAGLLETVNKSNNFNCNFNVNQKSSIISNISEQWTLHKKCKLCCLHNVEKKFENIFYFSSIYNNTKIH